MNAALAVLSHTLRMMFQNVPATLRVVWPGLLITGFANFYLTVQAHQSETADNIAQDLLLVLVYFFGYIITAIRWHRYVLLDDDPQHAATVSAKMVLDYALSAIVVGVLVTLLCLLPIILAVYVAELPGRHMFSIHYVMTIGTEWLAAYLAFRYALGLPASSIGDSIGVFESFRLTRPHAKAIAWLSTISIVTMLVNYAVRSLPDLAQILTTTFYELFLMLITIGILTTLYGHIIQKRDLPGLPADR